MDAAPQPGYKILFPARSRHGEMPRNKPMAQALTLELGGESCPTPHQGHLTDRQKRVAGLPYRQSPSSHGTISLSPAHFRESDIIGEWLDWRCRSFETALRASSE